MIIMAVFGGSGTILGPILGAFALSAISEILASKITSLDEYIFRPGDRGGDRFHAARFC